MKNILLILVMISCIKYQDQINKDENSSLGESHGNFSYKTSSSASIRYQPQFFDQILPDGHVVHILTNTVENGGRLIKKAIIESGYLDFSLSLGSSVEFIYLKYNRIGFMQGEFISIKNYRRTSLLKSFIDNLFPVAFALESTVSDYDRDGVPIIMLDPINVSTDVIDSIENSLPESRPVPLYHPDYIVDDLSANLCLSKDATGTLTFIHEGAGYRNTLGFFTFDFNSVPLTEDDITDAQVLFPNVSFIDSQRGLITGYTVDLGILKKGRCIGFFLVANGWTGNEISLNNDRYFSISHLNPEIESANRNHNVLLFNEVESLFILGFEDLNRESNSDDDFNDAVFSLTVTPIDAISNIDEIERTDINQDDDNDGISNQFDDFPSDPLRSFNNFYPSENSRGTLAFEDLWPRMGDYDFNDFMTYYNVTYITNSSSRVKEITFTFDVVATGASYNNGFAIELPILASNIESVEGNSITSNYIQLNSNGTEYGSEKAIIIITDDINDLLPKFTNVYQNGSIRSPLRLQVSIIFDKAVEQSILGTPPYKPFLIKNSKRGEEIHLAGNTPTSLFDAYDLFGKHDDNSLGGVTFINTDNMPWGINFPTEIPPIKEKESIQTVFLHFNSWAHSNGFNFMDWYEDKSSYRDEDKLIVIGEL